MLLGKIDGVLKMSDIILESQSVRMTAEHVDDSDLLVGLLCTMHARTITIVRREV